VQRNELVIVPHCSVCNALMTLQDTRPNEPRGGVDTLVYECEVCRVAVPT
jgi:hypothetical protein